MLKWWEPTALCSCQLISQAQQIKRQRSYRSTIAQNSQATKIHFAQISLAYTKREQLSPRIQRAHWHARLKPEAPWPKCVQSVFTKTVGFRGKEGQSTQWNQGKNKKQKETKSKRKTKCQRKTLKSFNSFIHSNSFSSQTQKNKKTKVIWISLIPFKYSFNLNLLFGYQPFKPKIQTDATLTIQRIIWHSIVL